ERGRAEGAFADGANEQGRAEGAFAEANGAPAANDEPATSRPGFGEASAPGAPGAEPPALTSRASAAKPKAPPPLTDPLRIEAGKLPGPTLKPASPGGAATSREGPAPRSPAIALYNEAERALIAGRGQDCLSLLERADATPGGPELREREQRAASPVVRAQCTMLLGRCDEGATRLRAAGWPNTAVEGARARFCAP
ncbi:MAG TPA: hypothetical protein VFS00_09795, partial [Polyangiaceae bacterium]|nr:hypothetical protein [Polyangiaceae bacterium]